MSKKALGYFMTFIMTASLLYCSIFTAFCETAPGEDTSVPGESSVSEEVLAGLGEDASFSEDEGRTDSTDPSASVTVEPSTVSLAQYPVLTVSAISNYFGRIDAEYNEFTREITVTYLLKSSRRLLSVFWTLTYDSALLTVDPEKNTAESVCPMMKDEALMSIDSEKGVICFSATDLKMFDYTTSEEVFVKIVFDTPELTYKDSEITKVDLSVSDLIVSEPNPRTGESYDGKEVVLVANSKVRKTDVQVSKYTTITPSTFVEPAKPATPDQKLTTSPPTTVKTTPATQPTEPQKKEEKKAENEPPVNTGTWYVALLILVILLVCSTILFVMRKRDIYNS